MSFESNRKRGFSLKELAAQMPLSVAFLRKEIKRGKLNARKYGDRVVVLEEDWDDYLYRRNEYNGEQIENQSSCI